MMMNLPGLGTGHSGGGLLGCENLSAYVLCQLFLLLTRSAMLLLTPPVHVKKYPQLTLGLNLGRHFWA